MVENRYQNSAALLERAKKLLAGGVSSEFRKYSYPHAMFYKSGSGSHIVDVDGNDYLDFTLSQGPLILGHSHPAVINAVTEASRVGQLYAGQHIRELELAEKINQYIPSAERMRFCLDGSTAVQTAFRVARAKTGRRKFLRFEGQYHGWLDNVSWGLSAKDSAALGSESNPNVYPWSEGLPEGSRDEFIIIPWNDTDLLRQTISEWHDDLAAVITEPIMCNSGCIMPRPGYLQTMRELCDQFGIALIFDEVICGFRLSLGGAQKHFGITPDLSVFAKAMASGYPISAVVGKNEWMQLIEEGKVIHAGTMNSSVPTIAAALATISVLETERPFERLFALGNKLMQGLKTAGEKAGHQILVQGPGPMFHLGFTPLKEVNNFRDTLTYDKARLSRFIAGMHNKGIRIIGRGLFYISAAHTEEEIDHAIHLAEQVFTEI